MEINDFLQLIKSELIDSADLISLETKFRQLPEWDSLTGMSIIVRLEETYGVKIDNQVFKSFITFKDMFDYLKESKKAK